MKIFKKFCMPNWLIKNFPVGEEDQTLSEIIVPTGIFTMIGIMVLCFKFFGTEWRNLTLLISCVVIILVAIFIYWISTQTELLKKMRDKNA